MKKIFHPASVAVIGASVKKEKIGGILIDNLLTAGYKGEIYPINPKYNQIKDLKCYQSVKEIKAPIDLAIIAIPAQNVPAVLIECATAKKAVKNFIIISAGFSEAGPVGQKLEKQILAIAQKYRLQIIGPNCLGIINTGNGLNASFAPNNFLAGNVGLISQSGAFAAAALDLGKKENLGFSSIVTIGNKTVLDETDFLEYFATDKKTKAIGVYLENIKRGAKFLAALKKTAKAKPIVIIKAGATVKTRAAIVSHTGAMAGDEEIAESLIEDCNGVSAQSISEFFAYLKMFSYFKAPKNKLVVLVTNAGGPGIMAADAVVKSSILNLYEFSESEKNTFKKILPNAGSYSNPLDLRGDATNLHYDAAIKELSKNKNIGSLIVIATAQSQTNAPAIWQSVASAQSYCPFPAIPTIMSDSITPLLASKTVLANFHDPLYAIKAIEKYYLWQNKKNTSIAFAEKIKINSARQRKSNGYLQEIKTRGRSVLLFSEALNVGKLYGLNVLPAPRISSLDLKKINYPAVLKIDTDKILHKNKAGGLIQNIKNPSELLDSMKILRSKFPKTDLIVQPQTKPGLELIIGAKHDDNFGPIIMLGVGGITAEIVNAKIFLSPMGNLKYLKEKIQNSLIGKLLAKQKINISLVAKEVKKVCELALENPSIKELDLNPILFYPNENPVIIDIKVICK